MYRAASLQQLIGERAGPVDVANVGNVLYLLPELASRLLAARHARVHFDMFFLSSYDRSSLSFILI